MEELLLNGNSCFSELTSNFPFFSNGSTWASLDIAASLFGTPSPSISSTIITVSHFPKVLAGNMSDLMLSPKYTTCRVSKREGDELQTLKPNSSFSKSQGKMACVTAPQGERDQTRQVCKSHHSLFDHHISFVLYVWKNSRLGQDLLKHIPKLKCRCTLLKALKPISTTAYFYSFPSGRGNRVRSGECRRLK